ncbi:MFS general substrate transporter [Tuber magnatum]|uniref:MFS general substrate transporter n=1 Tax=Tuber magnatum TaxID=42249 RepID=A0A317SVT7_9PEZI|nr:MFS general substrate transporter [Tuber magnatum]
MATTVPRKKKEFPTRQLFVLSLCRICEPISFCSIFPYIYYMIESFGSVKNANEIAVYAGMVTSAFAFAEFTTGMMWGRISDKFGRKPVLIMGLVGTMFSMFIFGFAKSFPVALIARAVGGALNGNVGVIQTTVAELATEKEYQARAFAVMPFIWCLGSIIGPALGGLLAEPVKRYPAVFHSGGVFEEYPYLLPNLVSAIILVVGIIIGTLFLEETHEILREKPDIGVRTGRKIVKFLGGRGSCSGGKIGGIEGYGSLPGEEGGLLASGGSEYSTFPNAPATNIGGEGEVRKRPPITKTFTAPVIMLIVSYGILAYHTMGFEQLFPVFLSTPRSAEPPHHLFKFTGGFGLDTQSIGLILSVQGVVSMAIQFFLFPPVVDHFGTLSVYRFCMFLYPISYLIVPYIDFLPPSLSMAGVGAVLLVRVTFSVLAYPCNAILLTNAAPSLLVLGSINGIAASAASLCRAFGPTITGIIYTQGLDWGMVGLAWWVNAGVCVLGGIQCLWMKGGGFGGDNKTGEIVTDEEVGWSVAVEAEVAHTTDTGLVAGDEWISELAIARKVASEEVANSFGEGGNTGGGREQS